jgi:hypothetical protein
MENLFLLKGFKNRFNEKVEEKYKIKEIDKDNFIYEFSYGEYNFKIDNEINLFINQEKIISTDIVVKKNIFSRGIYWKDKKLKLSKNEFGYLEVIFRNILSLNIDNEMYEFFHSLSSREKKFKENYLLYIRDTLFSYSMDCIYIYKYIYSLALSLNLEKNIVETLISKDLYKDDFLKDENEYLYFLNDFYYFFILFNFAIPKQDLLEKISQDNRKLLEYTTKKLYFKEIKNLESLNRYVSNKNKKQYLFSRQVYLNILKRNELNNMGGFNMFGIGEKRDFIIEFKDERDEKCRYVISIDNSNKDKAYVVEYLVSLKNEKNPILILGTDRFDFDKALLYKSEDLDPKEKDKIEREYPTIKKVLKNVKFREEEFINFPKISIFDITEKKILGFNEINREFLRDKGIWLNQGERYFELILENILKYFQNNRGYDIDFNLYLTRIGNDELEEKIKINSNYITNREEENINNDFIVKFDLDSDYLYETLIDKFNDKYLNINLEIEISFESNLRDFKIIVPFELKLKNAKKYVGDDDIVIDFGTSSTCVAYSNSEMITLENMETIDGNISKKSRVFENPTNFMINNWNNFSEKWLREAYPDIIRMDELGDSKGDFLQGYKLKEGVINREILNATLDKIKLIPYTKLKLNERLKFKAAIDNEKEITLMTGDNEKENEESFKPIVAYAYLLGRNIMSPKKGKSTEVKDEEISTKFRMTVPTKFDNEIKETIRQDIEMGLKLAAPQNIRDSIKVEIGNEEPVAFVGAMLREKKIKTENKFAIFDFGGGTLDFAFGIYREATDDEQEDEEVDYILEIYNTDGNERGGAEYLINKLSYYIYRENQDAMKENKIPFIVPLEEKKIEFFPEDLLQGKSTNAHLNLKSFNEQITRKIFINDEGSSSISMELKDVDNATKNITLTVDNSLIKDSIKNYMEIMVDDFIKMMERDIPEPYDNLKIFRAGNGSRSTILEEVFKNRIENHSKFSVAKIHFVDDPSQNGINPKTAVVLGEVNLRRSKASMKIVYRNKIVGKEDETSFEFYVGRQDKGGSSDFEELLYKGSTDKDWKEYGLVSREDKEKEIFYTNAAGITDIKDARLRYQKLTFIDEEMIESRRLWIRANSANKIEYIFSKKEPSKDLEGIIVELKR